MFHLKASGRPNRHRMDGAIELIERSRAAGAPVTADVYPYTASSTGLASVIPGRYHEGGTGALYDRLGDPRVGAEIRAELSPPRWGDVTEAENVLILQAGREEDRRWQGRTLAEIAAATGADPIEAAMDLIASGRTRIQGAFLRAPTRPRAYGSFARALGHYARDEKVLPLTEAIRRMTSLPAATLGLRDRGVLRAGSFGTARQGPPGHPQPRNWQACGYATPDGERASRHRTPPPERLERGAAPCSRAPRPARHPGWFSQRAPECR